MQDEIFFELGIGTRFRRILELMTSDTDRLYEDHGLDFRVSYFYPIYALHMRGPMPISDIAKLAGFSHSAVSQTLKKLSDKGLLETNPGADARSKTVSLTTKGEQLVDKLQPYWQALGQAISDVSSESGVDMLAGLTALETAFDKTSLYNRAAENLRSQKKPTTTFQIESYDVKFKQAFYDLNIWWLEKYFKVEPIDERVLSNPEDEILAKGGEIFFAVQNGKAVGTIAMKAEPGGVYELTKLAVDPSVQHGGMGRALCNKVIKRFKARGGKTLYLETNTVLEPAIKLYQKLGFVAVDPPSPSPYERANHYMKWQPNCPQTQNVSDPQKPSGSEKNTAGTPNLTVAEATSPADTAAVKDIFRAFINFLPIDLGFQGIEAEMAGFPSGYVFMLLAKQDGKAVGAVALKEHDSDTCEMKRLFVLPEAQGSGAGRLLCEQLMEGAKRRGYKTMLLDSLRRLESAGRLYQKLGFSEIEPYNINPEADVYYMSRAL